MNYEEFSKLRIHLDNKMGYPSLYHSDLAISIKEGRMEQLLAVLPAVRTALLEIEVDLLRAGADEKDKLAAMNRAGREVNDILTDGKKK